ncbi:MAG: LLM class flavin-dependent oxidoreductase [Thaumarchaeota archaeon]|nr:MAG: LLM class flavin-dependent oxidoreductase [Nitrososphaerota archaeon]
MTEIGYWASQEQYSMQQLIDFVKEAEKGGFGTTLTSDHFHPWSHTNGHGNFTWVWISAVAERTKKMKFLTGVTAAVYRYNPGIIAQAFASLDVLYPGRIGLGVGSGEAMNEVPLGLDWPSAETRVERTVEAIQIINKLWNRNKKSPLDPERSYNNNIKEDNGIDEDGFVTFIGKYFKIKNAKLYTSPSTDIPIYMAGSGAQAIKAAAKYTDGLITTSKPDEANEVFHIFDNAAKEVNKDVDLLQKIAKPNVSYSEDYDKAFKACEFWRTTQIDDAFNTNISDPRILEQKAQDEVSDDEQKKSTIIVTSIDELISPIEKYFRAGFTQIYIHSTSPDEIEFIRLFSKRVLPYFHDKWKKSKEFVS